MAAQGKCYLLLLFYLLFLEVAECKHTLKVQLYDYNNPFNLEYRSQKFASPYCCCHKSNFCSSGIENFSNQQCTKRKCSLKITVCAYQHFGNNLTNSSMETCYESRVFRAPSQFSFLRKSSMFPAQPDIPQQVFFNFDNLTNDLLLNVTLEVKQQRAFESVDIVTVPVEVCNLSSPAVTYPGVYGIASVTLAYVVITTSEEFIKDCVEKVTETITETEGVTAPSVVMVTVSETAISSSSLSDTSTLPWMPTAISLLVVIALAFLAMVLVVSGFVCVRKCKKSKPEATQQTEDSEDRCEQHIFTNHHEVDDPLDDPLYAVPIRIPQKVTNPGPVYSNVATSQAQKSHHYFELTTPS